MPGAYAGIVLDHFTFEDLSNYLAGEPKVVYFVDRGVIALLGCDCGEVGCWPLEARGSRQDGLVTWHGFVQPFRPHRDYRAFGPLAFQRTQYERAVQKAAIWPPSPRASRSSRRTARTGKPATPQL